MVKSRDLSEAQRSRIMIEEIEKFNKLVSGHKKLLEAIGKL
jgi:hypothetical protein